jgi:hypothetical protein
MLRPRGTLRATINHDPKPGNILRSIPNAKDRTLWTEHEVDHVRSSGFSRALDLFSFLLFAEKLPKGVFVLISNYSGSKSPRFHSVEGQVEHIRRDLLVFVCAFDLLELDGHVTTIADRGAQAGAREPAAPAA